jgi:hypothetical protein
MFDVLGVEPYVGRRFAEADGRPAPRRSCSATSCGSSASAAITRWSVGRPVSSYQFPVFSPLTTGNW